MLNIGIGVSILIVVGILCITGEIMFEWFKKSKKREIDPSLMNVWLKLKPKNIDLRTEMTGGTRGKITWKMTNKFYVRITKVYNQSDYYHGCSIDLSTIPDFKLQLYLDTMFCLNVDEYEIINDKKLIDKLNCLCRQKHIEQHRKRYEEDDAKNAFHDSLIKHTIKQKCED
jgi:hypothetical protein